MDKGLSCIRVGLTIKDIINKEKWMEKEYIILEMAKRLKEFGKTENSSELFKLQNNVNIFKYKFTFFVSSKVGLKIF